MCRFKCIINDYYEGDITSIGAFPRFSAGKVTLQELPSDDSDFGSSAPSLSSDSSYSITCNAYDG